MEKIDMEKLQNEIVDNYYKKNRLKILLASSGLAIGGVTLFGDYKNITAYIMLTYGVYKSKNIIIDGVIKTLTESDKYIRDSEEYKQTLLLYNEYVDNISNYLKELQFENSINETLYIDRLIDSGMLSYERKFNYKINKYESKYLPELLGARIASGTGVCRHIAGLSRDILSKREIEAITLGVRTQYGQHPLVSKLLHFIPPNHAVVGIIDKEGKYIFDPTMHFYAISPEQCYQSKKNIDAISQIINTDHLVFYNIYQGKFNAILKNNSEQDLAEFRNNPWKQIENEELEERKKLISRLFKETEYERELFHKQNKDLMTELAHMDSILSPYSDEEKTRWVLHKTK